jgi:hypothetical protein
MSKTIFLVTIENEDGSWAGSPAGYDDISHAQAQARIMRRVIAGHQVVCIRECREIQVFGQDNGD